MKIQANIFEFILLAIKISTSGDDELKKNSLKEDLINKQLKKTAIILKSNETHLLKIFDSFKSAFKEIYPFSVKITSEMLEIFKDKFLELCLSKTKSLSSPLNKSTFDQIFDETVLQFNKLSSDELFSKLLKTINNFAIKFAEIKLNLNSQQLVFIADYIEVKKAITCNKTDTKSKVDLFKSIEIKSSNVKEGIMILEPIIRRFTTSILNLTYYMNEIKIFLIKIHEGKDRDFEWRCYENNFDEYFSDLIKDFEKNMEDFIAKTELINIKINEIFNETSNSKLFDFASKALEEKNCLDNSFKINSIIDNYLSTNIVKRETGAEKVPEIGIDLPGITLGNIIKDTHPTFALPGALILENSGVPFIQATFPSQNLSLLSLIKKQEKRSTDN